MNIKLKNSSLSVNENIEKYYYFIFVNRNFDALIQLSYTRVGIISTYCFLQVNNKYRRYNKISTPAKLSYSLKSMHKNYTLPFFE